MDETTRLMIQRAIEDRTHAVEQSCNSGHIAHNEGVVRGLLWALTGEDPGAHVFDRYPSAAELFPVAGIPTRKVGDHIHYMIGGTPEEIEAELSGECEICKKTTAPQAQKKSERPAFDRELFHFLVLGNDTDELLVPALKHSRYLLPKRRIKAAIDRLARDGLVRRDGDTYVLTARGLERGVE